MIERLRLVHMKLWLHAVGLLLWAGASPVFSVEAPPDVRRFLDRYCLDCHDAEARKGSLDLTALKWDLSDSTNFTRWVLIHDRVQKGEMPPKKKPRPASADQAGFLAPLHARLQQADESRIATQGRALQRRLNRYEYENALRDLLQAPWLQLRDALPEDGEAHRFNKVGEVLDVSHVQMARYLAAADSALRQTIATHADRPPTRTQRFYTRDQRSYTGPMKFSVFNTAPERATFPVLGFEGQPDVRSGKAPLTSTNAELRELEGMGVVASAYEPIEPKFNQFKAPVSGRYKVRFHAYSVWVGPGESNKWFIPNLDVVAKGRRDEPVVIYSETPPRLLRWLGKFDVTPEPQVHELDVWLLAGETLRPDAARLFRSRPGAGRWQNPLAERDGQPGVVFRWLEVEGPLYDQWPPAGHQLLFGDLPMKTRLPEVLAAASKETGGGETNRARERRFEPPPGVEVISPRPLADAERLLGGFVAKAYRHPVRPSEVARFMPVVRAALAKGNSFTDSMIAAYTAVLSSPGFLYLEAKPGRLDDYALADRLSFFLWNTTPDPELRELAASKGLRRSEVLRAQTDRMLRGSRTQQFVDAFLDYWLDLRRMQATAPDATLYSDYYLDDLLTESALEETRAFFMELLREDLPASNLVASDFAMLNERLAVHYQLPAVQGVALRRSALPRDSVRGGLLTQAAVLKVTANGTTTSPVLRGAWVMERILGEKPPAPPPSVPAIEPDIRGATTVRQQLDRHRNVESCATCHIKIDPPGFALESFDVFGGWRERYRAEAGAGEAEKGIAKSGQKFEFRYALPVDAAGSLPDGRAFRDIREFKQLLLSDERSIARNLVRQLTVYATGAPVRFADRERIEAILNAARPSGYGVRTLVHELVQSDLFRMK